MTLIPLTLHDKIHIAALSVVTLVTMQVWLHFERVLNVKHPRRRSKIFDVGFYYLPNLDDLSPWLFHATVLVPVFYFFLHVAAALQADADVLWRFATDLDDLTPIHNTFAAGAANRSAGYFATLGIGLFDGNVFRMEVNEIFANLDQPFGWVFATEIAVSCVEVNPDRWRIY